jgi:hypothetical protein
MFCRENLQKMHVIGSIACCMPCIACAQLQVEQDEGASEAEGALVEVNVFDDSIMGCCC